MERIYRGKAVSRTYSAQMRDLLLQQERRWKILAGLPSGIKCANKTGETDSYQHDAAIVYGKKTDYVIVIFFCNRRVLWNKWNPENFFHGLQLP